MLFSDVMGDFQKLMKQETGIDGEATGKFNFFEELKFLQSQCYS